MAPYDDEGPSRGWRQGVAGLFFHHGEYVLLHENGCLASLSSVVRMGESTSCQSRLKKGDGHVAAATADGMQELELLERRCEVVEEL